MKPVHRRMVVAGATDPPDAANDTFLNDTWRAYAHHPGDSDWTHGSYVPIGLISSVNDFWTVWNACEPVIDRTMLFVMREHVFPSWDDPACIDGSIGSAIVDPGDAPGIFRETVQRALGETLMGDAPGAYDLNGVSIGPKRGFCVIKTWLRTNDADAGRLRMPARVDCSNMRFQPCRTHIQSARVAGAPAHKDRAPP